MEKQKGHDLQMLTFSEFHVVFDVVQGLSWECDLLSYNLSTPKIHWFVEYLAGNALFILLLGKVRLGSYLA